MILPLIVTYRQLGIGGGLKPRNPSHTLHLADEQTHLVRVEHPFKMQVTVGLESPPLLIA